MKDFIWGFVVGFAVALFGAGLYVRTQMDELSKELDKLEQTIDTLITD